MRNHKLVVLQIGPAPPQVGGMETFVHDLMQSTLAEHVDLRLLNISKPVLQRGGKYAIQPGYKGAFSRGFFTLLKSYSISFANFFTFLFRSFFKPIDIVHIHTASYTSFWEKCAYILFAKLTFKKVVLHIHGALFADFYRDSGFLVKRLVRLFVCMADSIVVLSQSWADFFNGICPATKIKIVENGINLDAFRNRQPRKTQTASLLYLGEVSSRKGIYDLLKAANKLVEEGYEFQYDIVGPGEIDKAQEMADDLKISRFVTFHGPQYGEKKLDFLFSTWGYILPSYAEGLPIAIIEAMAAGLPVLSTFVGGIPDIIEEGKNGLLCDPGRIDMVTKHIKKILTDTELRQHIEQQNRQKAFQFYDIDHCAQKIFDIYKSF